MCWLQAWQHTPAEFDYIAEMMKCSCVWAGLALIWGVSLEMKSAEVIDTTTVQTFTFEAQNNLETNYDSPGRRWFDFPASDNGAVYGKVLMDYTLKCFEDGTAGGLGYACGEWDYLTHTYLYEHTGVLDSAVLSHAGQLLADQNFDQADLLPYAVGVADSVWVGASASFAAEVISELISAPSGPGGEGSTEFSRRAQYLWTAQELSALGQGEAGLIHRLEFAGWGEAIARRMDVSWTLTNESALTDWLGLGLDWQSSWAYSLSATGGIGPDTNENLSLVLSPPILWDGLSNLVLDIAVEGLEGAPTCLADSVEGMAWVTTDVDQYVKFTAPDRVAIDPVDLVGLDSAITIECWVNGDLALQPENGTLFEAMNASGQRVVNVHLPWSNGRVYWDCGQDGGYDRIDAPADLQDYAGQWVHWAFTKDVATATMSIYKNGELWHTAAGKDNPILDITAMNLGASATWTNHYNGSVDDFRIWDVALDAETISAWMDRAMDPSHPQFDQLLTALEFEGENGEVEANQAPGQPAYHHGTTLRLPRAASTLRKGGRTSALRPRVKFGRGDYLIAIADGAILDLRPVAPSSLSTWSLASIEDGTLGNAGAGATTVAMTAISYHLLPGATYTVALMDDTLATHTIPGPITTVYNDELTYYGSPFEVLNRVELNRFITPYGIGLTLDDDGWTWTTDVTDYLPLLRDSVELQAGNWQELLDLKFRFIEGEPAREVLAVEAFWEGVYSLSNFDETVAPVIHTPQAGEEMWRLLTRASGHDFGSGNNCGEFCYNTHRVQVNGQELWDWEIMRECADNPLFPQGGTWIYDRAGWCPGLPTDTRAMELTPYITPGAEGAPAGPFTVEYDIDYDPYGNYRFEGQIISYGPALHSVDAELVEALAPSDDKVHSRFNPVCDHPRIVLRNSGSEPLTSCTITFGLPDAPQTFDWTGELEFLEEEEVVLTSLDETSWFLAGEDEDAPATLNFFARVSAPNNLNDQAAWNNEIHSTFQRPPTYTYMDDPEDADDNRLIIWVRTNLAPLETSVRLTHTDGTVYFERQYSEASTNYKDTIYLNRGCYAFEVFDTDQDGISFWANDDGAGFVRLRKAGGNFKTFEGDFGKSILHYFHFDTDLINDVPALPPQTRSLSLQLYPNPADDQLFFKLEGQASGRVYWRLYDSTGRQSAQGKLHNSSGENIQGVLPISGQSPGLYVVEFKNKGSVVRKRVIIE